MNFMNGVITKLNFININDVKYIEFIRDIENIHCIPKVMNDIQ